MKNPLQMEATEVNFASLITYVNAAFDLLTQIKEERAGEKSRVAAIAATQLQLARGVILADLAPYFNQD